MRTRELEEYKQVKIKMLADKGKLKKEREDNLVRIDSDELDKLKESLKEFEKNDIKHKLLRSGEV